VAQAWWPGEVARQLWPGHGLPYVPELIEARRHGEHRRLEGIVTPHALWVDVERLRGELEAAAATTHLPERATAHDALHDLVTRARMGEYGTGMAARPYT
jgi:hypothetical protein